MPQSGTRAAIRSTSRRNPSAVYTPAHSGEHRVVRALHGHVEVPGELLLAGHQGHELVAHRRRLDRAQAEPFEPRHGEDPFDEFDERPAAPEPAAPEVESVVAGVHPGHHHLGIASVHQPAHLFEHRLRVTAPGGAARPRDDAERARLVAPLLDLHERAAAVEHLGDGHFEELAGLRDGGHRNARFSGPDLLQLVHHPAPIRCPQHERDPRQAGQFLGRALRVAAGDHDLRRRVLGVDPPHRLACGSVGACGHAARVHHVDVDGRPIRARRLVTAGRFEQGADGLGVVLVETAAERPKGDPLPVGLHDPFSSGGSRPIIPDGRPAAVGGRPAGRRKRFVMRRS